MIKTQLIAIGVLLAVCVMLSANGQFLERNYPIFKRAALMRMGKRIPYDGQLRLLNRPSNNLPFRFKDVKFRDENGDVWDENLSNREDVKQAWREFLDKLYSMSDSDEQINQVY